MRPGNVVVRNQERVVYPAPSRARPLATFAPTPVPNDAYMADYDDDIVNGVGDDDGNGRRLIAMQQGVDAPRRLASDGTVTVETSTVTVTGITCDQVYAIVNEPESTFMNGEVTSGTDAHGVKCSSEVSVTAASTFKTCPGVLLVQDATTGTTQSSIDCNGRGTCDHISGFCECYAGYDSAACDCPAGQEPDSTNPTLCRLTAGSVESSAVLSNGVVKSFASGFTTTVPATPSPTVYVPPTPPGETVKFARLVMTMSLVGVNFDNIVWGDVKVAVVSALNQLLGYGSDARRLSKVAASMVTFIERSHVGDRTDMKLEVEMEENQVKALSEALATGSAKSTFEASVASKLKTIDSSTYSSVVIEVGATSMEQKDDTTTTQDTAGSNSNTGLIIGVIVTLGVVIGLVYFAYQRSQHMAGVNKDGTWKEETATEDSNPIRDTGALFGGADVVKSMSRHESKPMNTADDSAAAGASVMSRKTSRFAMMNPLNSNDPQTSTAAL